MYIVNHSADAFAFNISIISTKTYSYSSHGGHDFNAAAWTRDLHAADVLKKKHNVFYSQNEHCNLGVEMNAVLKGELVVQWYTRVVEIVLEKCRSAREHTMRAHLYEIVLPVLAAATRRPHRHRDANRRARRRIRVHASAHAARLAQSLLHRPPVRVLLHNNKNYQTHNDKIDV